MLKNVKNILKIKEKETNRNMEKSNQSDKVKMRPNLSVPFTSFRVGHECGPDIPGSVPRKIQDTLL